MDFWENNGIDHPLSTESRPIFLVLSKTNGSSIGFFHKGRWGFFHSQRILLGGRQISFSCLFLVFVWFCWWGWGIGGRRKWRCLRSGRRGRFWMLWLLVLALTRFASSLSSSFICLFPLFSLSHLHLSPLPLSLPFLPFSVCLSL